MQYSLNSAIFSVQLFVLIAVLASTLEAAKSSCASPLGLANGRIKDWQLSASSTRFADLGCHTRYGRLHTIPGYSWCPEFNSSAEFLQIDFGVLTRITGVLSQGRTDGRQWTKSYFLSYSNDATEWRYYSDDGLRRRTFLGNNDSHTLQYNLLERPISARFIRVEIVEWHFYPSLRLEILGCQQCNDIISYPPRTTMSASSTRFWKREKSCSASEAYFGQSGWCTKWNNGNQWLEFDLGPPTTIVGVMTKGRGGTSKRQWVTSFSISYGNSTSLWHYYKDDNELKAKEFGGNMDRDTQRVHYFNEPIVARYLRINPTGWKTRIAMRAAVLGCIEYEECPEGFLRPTEASECVVNLSHQKALYINDKHQSWSEWKYEATKEDIIITKETRDLKESSLEATSDKIIEQLNHTRTMQNKCAVLDNYFLSNPILMVDLGERKPVRGLVIETWSEEQNGTNHLEKLVVRVENQGKLAVNETTTDCGHIHGHQLVGKKRIHLQCRRHLFDQFVYIIAFGANGDKLFTALLCQVMVY